MIYYKNSKNLLWQEFIYFRYIGDDFMNSLFEYSDRLNAPFECFLFDTRIHSFPIRSHWHYFVEILYMLEGTAIINCDDDTYVLEEGDMTLFLPAGNPFYLYCHRAAIGLLCHEI